MTDQPYSVQQTPPPSASDLPNGWSESSYFRYQREHLTLALTTRNLSNHEIREILVGMWLRLEEADRVDHIKELMYYLKNGPGTYLSSVAQTIRDA